MAFMEEEITGEGFWCPQEIWHHEDLNLLEKVIMTEISHHTRNVGKCFLTNQHFSKLLKVTERHVARKISNLKKLGLIKEGGFDGRTRILISLI